MGGKSLFHENAYKCIQRVRDARMHVIFCCRIDFEETIINLNAAVPSNSILKLSTTEVV